MLDWTWHALIHLNRHQQTAMVEHTTRELWAPWDSWRQPRGISHTSISPFTSHIKRNGDFKGKGNMYPKPRYLKYVAAYYESRRRGLHVVALEWHLVVSKSCWILSWKQDCLCRPTVNFTECRGYLKFWKGLHDGSQTVERWIREEKRKFQWDKKWT